MQALNAAGRAIRLVSMPSMDVFSAQDEAWRESVLPGSVTRRLAVEAAARLSWWQFVGCQGRVLGLDRFGASGKAADLFAHFGFTVDHVKREIESLLQQD